jgi:hypothetical protein
VPIGDELDGPIRSLLRQAGLPGEFEPHLLQGGANNRVFRLDAGGAHVLLKVYFRHGGDDRDRIGAEVAFTRFAWEHGVRAVPRPLAWDVANRLALFEFVEGRVVGRGDVTADAVDEAVAFFRAVNAARRAPAATAMPAASEACFSLEEHLACVERRVRRLEAIADGSPVDREAVEFVAEILRPSWEAVAGHARSVAGEHGLDTEAPLPHAERCLSPSDFGFHNAIRSDDGRLRFVDFEYAGWDDPAKTVCDFFCQEAVPVGAEHHDRFVAGILDATSPRARHLERIRMLEPVYRVKWCCIVLNDFLPVGRARRRFSTGDGDAEARKAAQLEKARRRLLGMAGIAS